MEEDSRFALFVEPNAYIQTFNKDQKETKKIVFSEPYECLPSYYVNNNFKKKNCECVAKPKENCECDKSNQNNKLFGFDLKSLLPFLSLFNKGGTDLSKIVGLMNNSKTNANGENPMNIISSLVSGGGLNNILNMFKGGQKKRTKKEKEIETTDYEIKNYMRVE